MSENDQWRWLHRDEPREETSAFFTEVNTNYDGDIAMGEEEKECCCEEKSLDIADNLTEYSLNELMIDEREILENPELIELAENFNFLERFDNEVEVPLNHWDLFSIDIDEFYDDDMDVDPPLLTLKNKKSSSGFLEDI